MRMHRRIFISAALAVIGWSAVLVAPTGASAALVEAPSAFGPNTLTIDTSTNFAWLDLTESTNLSYSAVSGQFGAGGTFAGFRHGTRDEVLTLWANAGIVPSSGTDVPTATIFKSFQDKIGITGTFNNFPTSGVTTFISDGFTSTNSIVPGNKVVPDVSSDTAGFFGASPSAGNLSVIQTGATIGHYLVSPVPLPAALPLFLTALAGLGLVARQRRWRQEADA